MGNRNIRCDMQTTFTNGNDMVETEIFPINRFVADMAAHPISSNDLGVVHLSMPIAPKRSSAFGLILAAQHLAVLPIGFAPLNISGLYSELIAGIPAMTEKLHSIRVLSVPSGDQLTVLLSIVFSPLSGGGFYPLFVLLVISPIQILLAFFASGLPAIFAFWVAVKILNRFSFETGCADLHYPNYNRGISLCP
jgi:hypothetical protein